MMISWGPDAASDETLWAADRESKDGRARRQMALSAPMLATPKGLEIRGHRG